MSRSVIQPSSFAIRKGGAGSWTSANAFNISDRLRLLEVEDSVLGKQFVPLRESLSQEALTDREVLLILERAKVLLNQHNPILSQGTFLLLDINKDKIISQVENNISSYPMIAAFLKRNASLQEREHLIEELCALNVPQHDRIEFCRLLGTSTGATTLFSLLKGQDSNNAAQALAMFSPREVPLPLQFECLMYLDQYPMLGSIISSDCIVGGTSNDTYCEVLKAHGFIYDHANIDEASKTIIAKAGYLPYGITDAFAGHLAAIDLSLLDDGIKSWNQRESIQYESDDQRHALIASIRNGYCQFLREQRTQPWGTLPEQEIRSQIYTWLTPRGASRSLEKIAFKDLPELLSSFELTISDEIFNRCLFGRCRAELQPEQGGYNQALLKHIGGWRWRATTGNITGETEPATLIGSPGQLEEVEHHEQSSINSLASLIGQPDGFGDIFQREEDAYFASLPSIGLEIQNFAISNEYFLSWKTFLRSHGIASSWRPEFGSLVEASLPPFYNVQNIESLLDSLHQLDFFKKVDVAIHVSVGIETVEDLKYIAFGLMCCFPPRFDQAQNDAAWMNSLCNVFSKGLIYENPKSIPVHSAFPTFQTHAEMRVVSAFEDTLAEEFTKKLTAALSAVQWHGRELNRSIDERNDQFQSLCDSMDKITKSYGVTMLNVDWRIGTGDPVTRSTMGQVPAAREYHALRKFALSNPKQYEEMCKKVSELFLLAS